VEISSVESIIVELAMPGASDSWRSMGSSVEVVVTSSDVPTRLGLKATALAWLLTAWAFKIWRPGQSRQ
jgi:hypothetical protein